MRKIFLLSSVFLASVQAAQQDVTTLPQPLTVTSPNYCFDVNFTALVLRPFANNLDYAAEALPLNYGVSNPALSPSWVIPEISPNFHFGFDLGVAGIFHGANASLMLNWERYHTPNDKDSFTVATANMIGPFFEIGPDASTYKTAKGKVKFHFDEVNLDYGTFVRFSDLLRMNLFTGISFGRIHEHRFTRFADFSNSTVRTLDVPTQFWGFGPQLGFSFDYKIACGFQFVGTTRATLFVGKFTNHTTYTTTSPLLNTLGMGKNVQKTTTYHKAGIVPGFEGKLGLAYEYPFRSHYMFKIEAGYQAQIYLNSIRSTDLGSEVALGSVGSVGSADSGVYARTFQRTVSDFGLGGPYATINLAF